VAVAAAACAILGLWTQSAHIGAPPLGVARSNRHVWFRVDVPGSRLRYSVDHIRHLPELIVMADANVVAIPSTQVPELACGRASRHSGCLVQNVRHLILAYPPS
jgi:hypothetical protein